MSRVTRSLRSSTIPAVTVYSKPSCVQCNAVYRSLDKAGVVYAVVNVQELPEKLEEFKEAGFLQAPVVVAEGVETFAGFNPLLVKEIAELHGKKQ